MAELHWIKTSAELIGRFTSALDDSEHNLNSLAMAIGVTRGALHKFRNGDVKNVQAWIMEECARELGVSKGWLIWGTGEKDGDSGGLAICPRLGCEFGDETGHTKFCPEHGDGLIRECPECGKSLLAPGQNFCGFCGSPLKTEKD